MKYSRESFQLIGSAHAIANLSIGQITLDPINFNVTSGLDGLQGLEGSTTITGVDVTGGTSDGITLAINVTIHNPSNLNLSTGDLSTFLRKFDEVESDNSIMGQLFRCSGMELPSAPRCSRI